jgi:hypothetical protein
MDTDEIKLLEETAILFKRFELAVLYLVCKSGFSYKTCIAWMRFLEREHKKKLLRLTQDF